MVSKIAKPLTWDDFTLQLRPEGNIESYYFMGINGSGIWVMVHTKDGYFQPYVITDVTTP